MLLTAFHILLLLIGLLWFLVITFQQSSKNYFPLTPFILFGLNEMITVWGIPLSYAFKGESLDRWEVLVIGSAFLAFTTGFFLSGGSRLSAKSYISQPITAKYSIQYYFTAVVITAIIFTGLGLFYFRGLPTLSVSIFALLKGNLSMGEMAQFMSEQRFLLTKDHWFGGEYRGQGIINVTTDIGWRFIFAISLIMTVMLKSKKWFCLSFLTGFLLVMFQAGSGRRSPVVFSIVFIVLVLSLIQKTGPKHFIMLAALGFGFLFAITYTSAKVATSKDAPGFVTGLASQLVERIFLGNAIHDVELIGYVDSGRMEKRYGMNHIEKFFTSFPGVRMGIPLGYRISDLRNSASKVQASPTYIGFVYGDFGYIGVLIIFFLIGVVLSFIQKQSLKQKRDIMLIVLQAMINFNLAFMVTTGLIGFASNMVMVLLIWGVFHFFGSIFSKTYSSTLSTEHADLKGKLTLP